MAVVPAAFPYYAPTAAAAFAQRASAALRGSRVGHRRVIQASRLCATRRVSSNRSNQGQDRCSALSAHAQGKRLIVEEQSTRPTNLPVTTFSPRLKILNSKLHLSSKRPLGFLRGFGPIASAARLIWRGHAVGYCSVRRRGSERLATPGLLPLIAPIDQPNRGSPGAWICPWRCRPAARTLRPVGDMLQITSRLPLPIPFTDGGPPLG